ncbi:MAG: hypothetical protein FWC41_08255, partial [Firmicutes bacterium]|nr:hypothetical protein [Bacillota bacterium]
MKNLLKIILNLILIFFVFFVNIDNVSCFNLNFENFQRYETRIKKSSNLEIKIKSIFASFGFKLVHKGPIEEILKYEFDVNKLYKKISNTLKNYVVY